MSQWRSCIRPIRTDDLRVRDKMTGMSCRWRLNETNGKQRGRMQLDCIHRLNS